MANAILNFHFDFLNPSLISSDVVLVLLESSRRWRAKSGRMVMVIICHMSTKSSFGAKKTLGHFYRSIYLSQPITLSIWYVWYKKKQEFQIREYGWAKSTWQCLRCSRASSSSWIISERLLQQLCDLWWRFREKSCISFKTANII